MKVFQICLFAKDFSNFLTWRNKQRFRKSFQTTRVVIGVRKTILKKDLQDRICKKMLSAI